MKARMSGKQSVVQRYACREFIEDNTLRVSLTGREKDLGAEQILRGALQRELP